MQNKVSRQDPTRDLAFSSNGLVADADAVARVLKRIAHEIVERNETLDDLLVLGLQRGGVPLANVVASNVSEISSREIPCGTLDVSFYRDDLARDTPSVPTVTEIPVDVDGRTIVLVDDVLYTGRTVRAAMNALVSLGRPRAIQLAVLVDRGHRELPIRPDFVGKNVPTNRAQVVHASLDGIRISEGASS